MIGRHLRARHDRSTRRLLSCGTLAGPVFVITFTVEGHRRAGYDPRCQPVSSLALGPRGSVQRANFILVGGLYCLAARGLGRSSRRSVGPSLVPKLISGVGVALIGSGVFVTDPVAGFPPSEDARDDAGSALRAPKLTRQGKLHNLCAIPIFSGIPIAALVCAGAAAHRREYGWAAYCAGSAIGMAGAFALFGAAFGEASRLAGRSGVFQRISIATGFGWLSALSLRALRLTPAPRGNGTSRGRLRSQVRGRRI